MSSATERLVSESFEATAPKELTRKQKLVGERAVLNGFTLMNESISPNMDLMEGLKDRVINQDDAIESIINALDQSEVRLEGDNRPIANLAFLGPSGVGKSETAKALSELLCDKPNLIKIDCSNYAQGHNTASLTGAPPSYIGYDDCDPILSKKHVEKTGTVVLFDEIEKGSPELYDLMLQIMGDGEIKMANGKLTSFRNAIIVMTSNLGSGEMAREMSSSRLGFGNANASTDKKHLNKVATKSFAEYFRPEFIGRINQTVVFHPLDDNGLDQVLDVKVDQMNRQYEEEYFIRLSMSDATRGSLIEEAKKEPQYGARPLVRALEQGVQSELGRYIGWGQIPEGSQVNVFHKSEVPEDYPVPEGREYVFGVKPDESLLPPEPEDDYDEEFESELEYDKDVVVYMTGPMGPTYDYDLHDQEQQAGVEPMFTFTPRKFNRPGRR